MVASSTFALAALAAASSAMAHMELSWPYAFKSKFNPANSGAANNIDYSMTSPLAANQYPCKGYQDASAPSVATWAAGSTVNYTVAGTAIHGGGSCQLSMSYDEGKTWNVIYSIIGGCLIDGLTEEVVIPSDAPSGDALFAWGWFNLVGNREMYHNCAPVTITGGGSGLNSADYPAPFVANVDAAPGCKTVEGTEVVFPNPGKNVRYGGAYASGSTPQPGAGTTGDCGAVVTPSNPQSPSSSAAAPAASSDSASSAAPSASASIIGNQNHADPAPSASASASAPNCKRRSRRSAADREEHVQARHERLVRRKKMH